MTDRSAPAGQYPRDGYAPEWLALEDAMGGRFMMNGDLETEIPAFNTNFTALAKLWPELVEKIDVSEDTISEEPNWGTMKVRIYQPESSTSLPLMIFFHGGGFFCGNLETEDAQCRYFAAKTPCTVMSIDYPLSPPSLVEPILNAGLRSVTWCQSHASRYNADPTKTILCGGSAGAWMSVMLAYHFVQEKQLDTIAGCVLLFAATGNPSYTGKYKDKYTAWAEHGENKVPIINAPLVKRMWPSQGFDFASPRHFPLLAADLPGHALKGFPPCYFLSAEKDCLRDDGICFEMALNEVGVRTKLDFYPGQPHWFHAYPQLEVAHESMRKAVDGARFVLGAEEGVSAGGREGGRELRGVDSFLPGVDGSGPANSTEKLYSEPKLATVSR